jgi:hypothetical protein
VDKTAQMNYESYDQWNTCKIELRRSIGAGKLAINYAVTGTATLNTDYSLGGLVGGGYGDSAASEAGSVPGAILITYQYQTDNPGFIPQDPPESMWVQDGIAGVGA